jgi:hypothetical protein
LNLESEKTQENVTSVVQHGPDKRYCISRCIKITWFWVLPCERRQTAVCGSLRFTRPRTCCTDVPDWFPADGNKLFCTGTW